MIIWEMRIHIETTLIKAEAEYIYLSQVVSEVLPFVSLMKEIEFVIKLQGDAPTVLCSLFEKQ